MRKLFKNEHGAVGIVVALLIAAFGGAVITADNPKVADTINKKVLHKDDPNYVVPNNPSPKKTIE